MYLKTLAHLDIDRTIRGTCDIEILLAARSNKMSNPDANMVVMPRQKLTE